MNHRSFGKDVEHRVSSRAMGENRFRKESRMRSFRLSLLAGVVALVALVPSTALAQSPAGAGYDETNVVNQLPNGEVLGATSGGGGANVSPDTGNTDTPTTTHESGAGAPASTADETETTEAASGSLPFTGADAGLVALMGAVLLGTGLVLRRNSRSHG
jgi:hypothetical protein